MTEEPTIVEARLEWGRLMRQAKEVATAINAFMTKYQGPPSYRSGWRANMTPEQTATDHYDRIQSQQ